MFRLTGKTTGGRRRISVAKEKSMHLAGVGTDRLEVTYLKSVRQQLQPKATAIHRCGDSLCDDFAHNVERRFKSLFGNLALSHAILVQSSLTLQFPVKFDEFLSRTI